MLISNTLQTVADFMLQKSENHHLPFICGFLNLWVPILRFQGVRSERYLRSTPILISRFYLCLDEVCEYQENKMEHSNWMVRITFLFANAQS